SFASGTLACLVPYALAGITSPTALYERLRGGASPTEVRPFNDLAEGEEVQGSGSKVQGSGFRVQGSEVTVGGEAKPAAIAGAGGAPLVFGHKDRTMSTRFSGPAAAAAEFVSEFLQATAYVLPLLALAGYWIRRRVKPHP